MVEIETLPSGGACKINAVAAQADLLIAEGFIEPHFFAGFSGSRKSVLPDIASYETIMYNHDGAFARSGRSRAGVLEGIPCIATQAGVHHVRARHRVLATPNPRRRPHRRTAAQPSAVIPSSAFTQSQRSLSSAVERPSKATPRS